MKFASDEMVLDKYIASKAKKLSPCRSNKLSGRRKLFLDKDIRILYNTTYRDTKIRKGKTIWRQKVHS
jgi:hypothetical protein